MRYTALQDVGKAIHPSYVEGQLQGGAAQGIGWALNEEYIYDEQGRLLNASLLDYRMPTALDLPMIDTVLVEVPNPGHPYGVRGVGETPIVPPAAAVANAVYRATGVRMTSCPCRRPHHAGAVGDHAGCRGNATVNVVPRLGLALHIDPPAVRLHQLAGNRQPQPAAGAGGVAAGAVAAPEAVEDVGQLRWRDALARVAHLDAHTLRRGRGSQGDRPTCRRVAQGVGHQVAQNLVEAAVVGGDGEVWWVGGVGQLGRLVGRFGE